MVSSRRLTLLVPLVLAVGLLASCVPIPPYDPALAQHSAYVQATIVSPLPTGTAAPLVRSEPTNAPAVLAQSAPTAAPVTVTISLAQPAETLTSTLAMTQTVALVPIETLTPTETVAPTPTISFTATPAPTSTPRPTDTVAAISTRAATSTRALTPTATVDQHLIVITEDDIARAVAEGAGAQQGMTVENLEVRFVDGKIHITADRLGYGIIKMQNLDLVGRLVAQNGVLNLVVESISPRGLAANFVPSAANQALANFGSQWYVEEVRTLDGKVELRVR
jgi:hypothetical protein